MYKTLGGTLFRGEDSMCEGEALFAAAVVNVHNYAWAFLLYPPCLLVTWPNLGLVPKWRHSFLQKLIMVVQIMTRDREILLWSYASAHSADCAHVNSMVDTG